MAEFSSKDRLQQEKIEEEFNFLMQYHGIDVLQSRRIGVINVYEELKHMTSVLSDYYKNNPVAKSPAS